MKSITIFFVGSNRIRLEIVKRYFSKFTFIETKPISTPDLFFKSSLPKKGDVIIFDLPNSSQLIYENGIKLMKMWPGLLTIALSKREHVSKILSLQHIKKFYNKIISVNNNLSSLELIIDQLKQHYLLVGEETSYNSFTTQKNEEKYLSVKN